VLKGPYNQVRGEEEKGEERRRERRRGEGRGEGREGETYVE
jgi:hypothetical protein